MKSWIIILKPPFLHILTATNMDRWIMWSWVNPDGFGWLILSGFLLLLHGSGVWNANKLHSRHSCYLLEVYLSVASFVGERFGVNVSAFQHLLFASSNLGWNLYCNADSSQNCGVTCKSHSGCWFCSALWLPCCLGVMVAHFCNALVTMLLEILLLLHIWSFFAINNSLQRRITMFLRNGVITAFCCYACASI